MKVWAPFAAIARAGRMVAGVVLLAVGFVAMGVGNLISAGGAVFIGLALIALDAD